MKKHKWFRPVCILLLVLTCFCGACSAAFAEGEGEPQTDPAAALEPLNDVPLVIVRVDESKTNSIDSMNKSPDHSVRCEAGTVEIKLPEGYKAPEGYTKAVPAEGAALKYVRGRGNSTWSCNKKPYKIELKEAADFFGMGESTDWALLANAYDNSLMRNRLIFWLGEQMGLKFTPKQVPVDLVMVGDNKVYSYGSYCLCETIDIGPGRIDIGKLKKNDMENITGGYLLATYSDQDGGEDPSTWFTTKHGVEIYNDSPDFMIEPGKELSEARLAQRAYIRGYVQEVEDLIMDAEMEDGKITEEAHKKIEEKMDLQSAADFWLLQEIPFNTDGYATTSTYFYKARDGKLCWGPLWDFDYAFWNNSMEWTESNQTFNNTSMLWIDYLRENDPQFAALLKERWEVMKGLLQDMTRTGGIIDQYEAEVAKSRQADYDLWKDEEGNYAATAAATAVSKDVFDNNISNLKSWTDDRRAWAAEHEGDLDQVYFTVTYKAGDETVATEKVRYGQKPVMNPDAPAPEGQVLKAWKIGEREASKIEIKEDTVVTAEFVNESDAVAPESLEIYIPDVFLTDGKCTVDVNKGFFPVIDREGLTLDIFAQAMGPGEVTNPRITWTSSDENVGTIDPVARRVALKGCGETTITGTLYNGVTGSFVLKVTGVCIQDGKVALSSDAFTYNGKVQKPEISSVGDLQLTEGTDYMAEWSNEFSKNAGTYTVTVTGKGKYEGTAKASYEIKKAANPLKVSGKTAKVKAKKVQKKKQVLAASKLYKFSKKASDKKTYTLASAKKGSKSFKKYFKVNSKTGKMTVKKGLKRGTYKVSVRIKAAGNSNYEPSAVKTAALKIRVK